MHTWQLAGRRPWWREAPGCQWRWVGIRREEGERSAPANPVQPLWCPGRRRLGFPAARTRAPHWENKHKIFYYIIHQRKWTGSYTALKAPYTTHLIHTSSYVYVSASYVTFTHIHAPMDAWGKYPAQGYLAWAGIDPQMTCSTSWVTATPGRLI